MIQYEMPNDLNQTQFANDINRTLSETIMTSMAECFAAQQGVVNIPSYDGKNIPVRFSFKDIINGESSVSANCETQYLKAVLAQLKGAAGDSFYGKSFTTIKDLVKHLK